MRPTTAAQKAFEVDAVVFMASFKSSSNPVTIQWDCVSVRGQSIFRSFRTIARISVSTSWRGARGVSLGLLRLAVELVHFSKASSKYRTYRSKGPAAGK